jgi:putative thioredoxin
MAVSESPHKITATMQNFMSDVVEASVDRPILVDFWAPWCAPCLALMPTLDRLAEDYGGRFTLAKVNVDEQPEIAGHFQIRSIPTLMLVNQREVVESLVGGQSEQSLRSTLDRYVKEVVPEAVTESEPDPAQPEAMAERQLARRDAKAAADAIDALAADKADHPLLPSLRARLTFLETANAQPDAGALRAAVETMPSDSASRHALACHYALAGDYASALSEWLELIRRDRNHADGVARRSMLMAFDVLGADDPLVAAYRRKLAAALN